MNVDKRDCLKFLFNMNNQGPNIGINVIKMCWRGRLLLRKNYVLRDARELCGGEDQIMAVDVNGRG